MDVHIGRRSKFTQKGEETTRCNPEEAKTAPTVAIHILQFLVQDLEVPAVKKLQSKSPHNESTFYLDEPDHNHGNKPRLDILISFNDGEADLISSSSQQPTKAMRQRYNLREKLTRQIENARLEEQ